MRSLAVHSRGIPHAVLAALAIRPMTRKEVYDFARLFGRRHAANVAVLRLCEQGLIEIEARITEEGKKWLRGAGE